MELRHLKYFKVIAETENVSVASRRLHVSQPFLSRTIKTLEDELQISLFDRTGKKITLNKYGRILYKHTIHILSLESQILNELQSALVEDQPSLKLVLFNATNLFPKLIAGFSDHHPEINFSISNYDEERLKKPFDVVIHASEGLASSLPSRLLFPEECLLGMSREHPLANAERITPDMLKNEKFLLLTQENSLGDLTRRYFVPLGITPRVPLECESQQTLNALVEQNMGLAFFPSRTWKVMSDNIILHRIDGFTLSRNIYLSRSTLDISESVQKFLDYMNNAIEFMLTQERHSNENQTPKQ